MSGFCKGFCQMIHLLSSVTTDVEGDSDRSQLNHQKGPISVPNYLILIMSSKENEYILETAETTVSQKPCFIIVIIH